MTSTSYPFSADDQVMLGIVTWQSPRAAEGPRGPICRYFIDGVVLANDREAGLLVVRLADGQVEVLDFAVFGGDEVVAFDPSLPRTAAEAHARVLRGEPTEPAETCAVCGAPADYRLTDPTDATVCPIGTAYCGPCTTSTAAGFAPIH